MPTIDQRELGICAEQQSEEWEVLLVRSTPRVHAVLFGYLRPYSRSTLIMSPETHQAVS
jgi:hypothetical protein